MATTLIQRSRAKRPSEKAAYHQVTGAGARRVLRPFFGVSPSDERALTADLDRRLTANLNRQTPGSA